MDSQLTPRQRVYLSARTIFNGQNSLIRRSKKIKDLVQFYRSDLHELIQEFGENRLVDIIKTLLEERIFESVLQAKAEFPGLFPPAQLELEREATELKAIQSTETVLEEIQSGNEDITLTEDVMIDQRTSPPAELLQTAPHIPSLYPLCIPYKPQYCILTTAQRLLEECCFDFAKQWLPNIVNDNGWDCGAAVELTQWTGILSIEHADKIPSHALDLVKSPLSLNELFLNTHKIRHTAVHRVPTTARGISRLLDYGVQLAEALRDNLRASQLEKLKVALDDQIKSMELNKNFLESETITKLESIRRQKEELERQERELIAHMVKEDQENKALIGRLLMESIENALSPNTQVEEDEVLHAETDLDGPREYQIEDKGDDPPRGVV